MLSSISQYVRMLDGRDRGHVLEVNREIAQELIERKQAIEVGPADFTSKPWDEAQLAAFKKGAEAQGESELPGIVAPVVEANEVSLPRDPSAAAEVSIPRAKSKKR